MTDGGERDEGAPGEAAEFAFRCEQHRDDLRGFIASLVRDRHLRDDILQETLLVAWRRRGDFQAERGAFGAWLRGIAANKIMTARGRAGSRTIPFDADAMAAVAAVEIEEDPVGRREALRACLERLGPEARELLAQRYGAGATLNQLAQARRQPIVTVHRVLERLRASLHRCVSSSLGEVRT